VNVLFLTYSDKMHSPNIKILYEILTSHNNAVVLVMQCWIFVLWQVCLFIYFFPLWGRHKSVIFNKKPRMSIGLKENIRSVCSKALRKVLTIVSTSLDNKLNVCNKLYGMRSNHPYQWLSALRKLAFVLCVMWWEITVMQTKLLRQNYKVGEKYIISV
jgi:hypothetical protein